jgi:hypothetical protein
MSMKNGAITFLFFPVPEMIDWLSAGKTNFGLGFEPVTELGRGHEQMSVPSSTDTRMSSRCHTADNHQTSER